MNPEDRESAETMLLEERGITREDALAALGALAMAMREALAAGHSAGDDSVMMRLVETLESDETAPLLLSRLLESP